DYFDVSAVSDELLLSATTRQIPGKAVVLSPSSFKIQGDEATVDFRIVKTPSRIFRLSVSHPTSSDDSEDAQYFFSAFNGGQAK
ncbi:MAG: hypothetical protein ACREDR_42660, partial [Blastocatellia bacterium]